MGIADLSIGPKGGGFGDSGLFGTVASNRVSPSTGDAATEDKEQFVWVYVLSSFIEV